MGRSLNKKYFGNRNVGTTATTDNGLGGEGIASITTATAGSININNTYPNFPTLTVAAPTLPGGVTATTATTWEIESITIGGTNTGYTINQTGAAAVLTGLESQASVDPVITVNTNGSGNVSAISFAGGRGEWTSIDGTGITTWAITGAGGSNAQATVKFRVKSIAITEKGSGYVSLPSLSWTALGGTTPSAQTPSLTTDSNNFTNGSADADNQENAIIVYADVDGNGAVIGDIVKQQSGRRYKVKTAAGTAYCKLVADGTPAQYEMYMIATDVDTGTYYVTKLTGHRATLTPLTGVLFAEGESTGWSFAAAAGTVVQIANA